MNISTPVLSTIFTKSLSNNIDRKTGMLYNNNVGDSFSFGNARNRRYEKLSRIPTTVNNKFVMTGKKEKMDTPNKKGLNDILSMVEEALSKDSNEEYSSIMKEVYQIIQCNFDYSSEKTLKDTTFLDSLDYYLHENPARKNIEKLVQDYKKQK